MNKLIIILIAGLLLSCNDHYRTVKVVSYTEDYDSLITVLNINGNLLHSEKCWEHTDTIEFKVPDMWDSVIIMSPSYGYYKVPVSDLISK